MKNRITKVQLLPSAPTCHNTMLAVRAFSVGDKLVNYGSLIEGLITDRDTITKVYKNGKAKGLTFRKFKIMFKNSPVQLLDGSSRCLGWNWQFEVVQ